jgi:hypothetical protein
VVIGQCHGIGVQVLPMLRDGPKRVGKSGTGWALTAGIGVGEAPADEGGNPAEQQNP